jgi:lysozyme family protein
MPAASFVLNDPLRQEYVDLFKTCAIGSSIFSVASIDTLVNKIVANQPRYKSAADLLSIPWFFIGAIHNMESSLRLDRHLHNGDPLTARTVHVPAGRPIKGEPPFAWEVSAEDALTLRRLDKVKDWTLAGILFQMEGYNGFGYRQHTPKVLTPYLWSGSNHYTKGKYVKDGKFDPDAVSKQIGAATVLRRMAERQIIPFDPNGDPITGVAPRTANNVDEAPIAYSETVSSPAARTLQIALNQFPNIFLLVDGIPGPKTSDALKLATGHYLRGDPRADKTMAAKA